MIVVPLRKVIVTGDWRSLEWRLTAHINVTLSFADVSRTGSVLAVKVTLRSSKPKHIKHSTDKHTEMDHKMLMLSHLDMLFNITIYVYNLMEYVLGNAIHKNLMKKSWKFSFLSLLNIMLIIYYFYILYHSIYIFNSIFSTLSQRWTLTNSHQEYYIFSGPPCGIIFSKNLEKISSH